MADCDGKTNYVDGRILSRSPKLPIKSIGLNISPQRISPRPPEIADEQDSVARARKHSSGVLLTQFELEKVKQELLSRLSTKNDAEKVDTKPMDQTPVNTYKLN